MRGVICLLLLVTVATGAEARCWNGENVSWYVDRHTASGEKYRHNESTCAHRTAKFGTKYKVTDRRTGRSTVCRVNDRGPNKWTKCEIDLNRHAARRLGITERGVVTAKIEVVSAPLVEKARAFLGTNPTGWSRVWCGRFMAMIAPELAAKVSNPNLARAWASLPRAAPQVGAIVVLARGKGGGHIGVVSGFDDNGNPRVVSGNHNRRVAESVYPKSRVIAYVSGG